MPLASLLLAALPLFAASLAPLSPRDVPRLRDDLPPAALESAAKSSLAFYESEASTRSFPLGDRMVTGGELAESIRLFLSLYKEAKTEAELQRAIRERFQVFRSPGQNDGKVLFTGYFEPVVEASLTHEGAYSFPLYAKPPDLVEVELDRFPTECRGQKIWGRLAEGRLGPYLDREQIDFEGALQGREMELAWLKSRWDVLNVHIQGSTKLALPDGRQMRALFAATNGLPFRSPARALVEAGLLAKERWSAQAAREYLDAHPEDERRIYSENRRYTFFRLEAASDDGPLGTIRRPLTAERSIAVDATMFPLGGLAFYAVDLPTADGGTRPASRFAFMQDTGGAILGPGRVDIFMGSGDAAFAVAGRLKAEGDLYILLKK